MAQNVGLMDPLFLRGEEPAGREPAPGAARLVQRFVNTTDRMVGLEGLESPDDLATWLEAVGLGADGGRYDAADLARALDFRESLRGLLVYHSHGHPPTPSLLARLRGVAAGLELEVRFEPDGSTRLAPRGSGIDRVLGDIVAAAYTAMAEGTWARLKACRSPECRWAFYDSSKNRSGAWCTMSVCGARAKVRRYRRRRAA